MVTAYIDSHTHIDQHNPDEWAEIVARAQDAGVRAIIAAGVTIESSERCIRMAEQFPLSVWAGVGVHPMDLTGRLSPEHVAHLRTLASHEQVVCISEIGLDWEPGRPDRMVQEQAFRAQLRLAVELNLPVIFHNREAGLEPLRIIHDEVDGKVAVVAHYFQGPLDYALACIELGIYLSLAKPLLRLPELQDIIANHAPLDSLVLETDSYPQPYKKNRNNWTEPRDIPQIAAKVAELKGVSEEEVAEATTATMARVLRRDVLASP